MSKLPSPNPYRSSKKPKPYARPKDNLKNPSDRLQSDKGKAALEVVWRTWEALRKSQDAGQPLGPPEVLDSINTFLANHGKDVLNYTNHLEKVCTCLPCPSFNFSPFYRRRAWLRPALPLRRHPAPGRLPWTSPSWSTEWWWWRWGPLRLSLSPW